MVTPPPKRQTSVAVNAPGGRKELKRRGRKIFGVFSLTSVYLSRLVSKRCNATSAPDCNIGPPRDGETPRADKATSKKDKAPPPPRVLFSPPLHYITAFCPLCVVFPCSRGHSRGGTFPSPLCVSAGSLNACNACRHRMQGHLFFLSRLFFLLLCPVVRQDGTTRWGQRDGTMPMLRAVAVS